MTQPPTTLYHGTSNTAWQRIIAEGLAGPSYWGTLEEAAPYAEGGQLIALSIDRFNPDGLMPNSLLAESLQESGSESANPETWQDSLSEFGSVRYDFTLLVTEEDLHPLEKFLADQPNFQAKAPAR